MSILSITFHATPSFIESWDNYLDNDLLTLIENLIDVDEYILSEVQTDMITDGKNTNLFLIFANDELRAQFMKNEMLNLEDRILKRFAQNVMVFPTFLNPIKRRK